MSRGGRWRAAASALALACALTLPGLPASAQPDESRGMPATADGAATAASAQAPATADSAAAVRSHSVHGRFPGGGPQQRRVQLLPGHGDALFALAAAGGVAFAAVHDRRWSAVATADHSRRALDLAADVRRLGEPMVVGAGLLAVDGAARWTGHYRVGAASERIAVAVAAASVTTLALKVAVGRSRPDETRDAPWNFAPVSNHDSFPSGHSTVAFSFVAALDAETRTAWVPILGYPAATLTAWSRLHDRKHWPSDVVAGAAIGGFVGRKASHWAQVHLRDGLWVLVWPARGGATARAGVRF